MVVCWLGVSVVFATLWFGLCCGMLTCIGGLFRLFKFGLVGLVWFCALVGWLGCALIVIVICLIDYCGLMPCGC